MKIVSIASVLTLLVMLAAPGSHSLPAATHGDDNTVQIPDTALSETSDLANIEGDRARRATRTTVPPGVCVTELYIMGHTSGVQHGGSDQGHAVEMVAKGQTRAVRLPDLPGDDYYSNKGDLWKIPLKGSSTSVFGFTGCIRKGDIESITLTEHSNDGWNIDSIITVLRADTAYEVATMDMDVNRWIDGDGALGHRRFQLTMLI